jgi:hypothetical protein
VLCGLLRDSFLYSFVVSPRTFLFSFFPGRDQVLFQLRDAMLLLLARAVFNPSTNKPEFINSTHLIKELLLGGASE